jgi:hypothetical protein
MPAAEDAQLSIGAEKEPPRHRVTALAGILAGFRFPGRSLERLTNVQRNEVYAIARNALQRLEEVE